MSQDQAKFSIIVTFSACLVTISPGPVADTGRIRTGGACRILPPATQPTRVVDTGRIRMGGACRIPLLGRGRA